MFDLLVAIMNEYALYRKVRKDWIIELKLDPIPLRAYWFIHLPILTLGIFVWLRFIHAFSSIVLLQYEYKLIRF